MAFIFLLLLLTFLVFHVLRALIRPLCYEDLKDKVVLITGASSGIGEQLAYEYGKKGAALVLVARREDNLQQVAQKARSLGSPDVLVVPADVSKAEDCKRAVDMAVAHFGKLNHMVSNAGMGSYCPLEDAGNITRFTRIMDVNFWGSVFTVYHAIPHLRKSGGRIVVIGSVAGCLPLPGSTFYTASKAAINMFYETLRMELGSAVGLTIVHPGWVKTEITKGKAMVKGGNDGVVRVSKDAALRRLPIPTAEGCAKAVVESACRGDRHRTWPSWYCLVYLLHAITPAAVQHLFLRKFYLTKLAPDKNGKNGYSDA